MPVLAHMIAGFTAAYAPDAAFAFRICSLEQAKEKADFPSAAATVALQIGLDAG
jgi:hypothetical protein